MATNERFYWKKESRESEQLNLYLSLGSLVLLWSPDCRSLALGDGSYVYVYRLATVAAFNRSRSGISDAERRATLMLVMLIAVGSVEVTGAMDGADEA
ncbi:MAG: hypothetical protein IT422_01240 [Pirellulaceae bacterium]|nr:hypothetical protein [Pirellulaceae bacterium]